MEALTVIHVGFAFVALITGALAASFRKGGLPHVRVGYVFAVSMIVMAMPAGWMSYQIGKPFDVLSGLMTLYMVVTGVLAFRTNLPALVASMAAASLCVVGYLAIEINTMFTGDRATDAPVGAGFVFAAILSMALYGDWQQARQVKQARKAILVRHLWRMNFAFFMATFNLFAVRPHLFPEWMSSYGILLLLGIAPLLVMAYWRVRVMLVKSKKPLPGSTGQMIA